MNYREYFDIDPDYFPQATEELINSGKVDWKKFYPHETFVKLISDTIRVLTRQQKLSLWVEGAYGTGKSHAVLTLQKLLDASEKETKAYFDNYDFMSEDLFNKLQGVKKQGTLLTVRRYGSSSVNSDTELIFCIQESIVEAFKRHNIKDVGSNTLKKSVITWLKDENNCNYFDNIISSEKYNDIFKDENAISLCQKLKSQNEYVVMEVMDMILKASNDLPRNVFKIDMNDLILWIKEIIKNNNLKAIFFIWDEFTEFFQNNYRHLTEFQKLIEISQTNPFYMCIVTHKSTALFNDNDDDRTKILGRFVSPTCKIELPENMAFRLMGQAMEKSTDPDIRNAWNIVADDLNRRLYTCRNQIMQTVNVTEKELMDILPMHPYAALILKHISSAFDSDQRSMFDFIKNDRGEEIKGFQWFIDNHDPIDEDNALLTIDLLWDFFYEKGKDNLIPSIRNILDSYHRQNVNLLMENERKVLKTVLILQAISEKVGDRVEVFIPNSTNVNYAYEGTELENGQSAQIAEKLCKQQILYKKPVGNGKFQFSAMTTAGDSIAIEKNKNDIAKMKKTRDFIHEGEISNVLNLSGALELRCVTEFVTADDFKRKINELRNKENQFNNKILIIVACAKNESESATLNKQIKEAVEDKSYNMIFVDCSSSVIGRENINLYLENTANSMYQRGKDNAQADRYSELAKEVLKKWKDKIYNGEFSLYHNKNSNGIRVSNIDELKMELSKINHSKYPYGIEQMQVIDNMFSNKQVPMGVECGATENLKFTYASGNQNTNLINSLKGAWKTERYWEKLDSSFKYPCIKLIKLKIEEVIKENFNRDGQVSIANIYNSLKNEPFGIMPCNLTAFILGFVLKEYANDSYRWNDGQTSEVMSISKLKEMIHEIIKQQISPSHKYKNKYIVTMTIEQKAFSEITSKVFNIPPNECASVQQTRDRIRNEMKKLLFPMWSVRYIIDDMNLSVNSGVLEATIDNYCGIANTANIAGSRTETDLAQVIGKNSIENPTLGEDLYILISKENCQLGMLKYISEYKDGTLSNLAEQINAGNLLASDLRKKFDADEANWVWNIETANTKIDELIIEYQIIKESNKITSKSRSYDEMIQAWCDKLGILKLSFEAIKSYCEDIKPLLELLCSIKKSGILQYSNKEKFLSFLQLKGESLKKFFINQINIFKQVCQFQLFGLNDDEINQIYKNLHDGMFAKENHEFISMVESNVENYKKTQEKRKLKELWKKKSGSNTPQEWSNMNKTPIMCMVPLDETLDAQKTFNTINRNNPEKNEIKIAINYLNKTTFFEYLNNVKKQDELFIKLVVAKNVTMLNDLNEVRDYLYERVDSQPDNWFNSIKATKALEEFAKQKYIKNGSVKALHIIEEMDEVTVKKYLKQLIKENYTVGMEIIKDNN